MIWCCSACDSTPAPTKTAPCCCLASGNKRGGGRERPLFLIPGYCGACGESSRERWRQETESVSRASSSPGRKEEFPLASDCLTRKNVAFVAGLRSFFFFFFGSLSVTSCLPFLRFSLSAPLLLHESAFQPSVFRFCSAAAATEADWFLSDTVRFVQVSFLTNSFQ